MSMCPRECTECTMMSFALDASAQKIQTLKAALALIMADCATVTECVEVAKEAMQKIGEYPCA